jgi:uncharacterized protein
MTAARVERVAHAARGSLRDRYGHWALVTGASEGIGREFARELARAGLNLVLVARRRAMLEELAAEVARKFSVNALILVADLSSPAAAQQIQDETAGLDVGLLVAAAGFGTSGPLLHSTLAVEVEMVHVNCGAVLALSWYFGRRFAKRGRGGLVLLSSLLAFHGAPFAANYAATKAYVQSLGEGLNLELGPLGVDVIACAPGPTRTGFGARADLRMSMSLEPDVVARATLTALGARTTVRPGWLSKLLGWSLAMLPRWGQVRLIAQIMKQMTAHQARGTGGLQDPGVRANDFR